MYHLIDWNDFYWWNWGEYDVESELEIYLQFFTHWYYKRNGDLLLKA